jgi:hypothetical protein
MQLRRFLTQTLFLFYKIKATVAGGSYIKVEGSVVELIDEKKKAIDGEMVSLCYPRYATIGDKELSYVSFVKRRQTELGQAVTLCYEERTGLIWAQGDLELLKGKYCSAY